MKKTKLRCCWVGTPPPKMELLIVLPAAGKESVGNALVKGCPKLCPFNCFAKLGGQIMEIRAKYRNPEGGKKGDMDLCRKQVMYDMLKRNMEADKSSHYGTKWRYFVEPTSGPTGLGFETCRRAYLSLTGSSHWLMTDCKRQLLTGEGRLKYNCCRCWPLAASSITAIWVWLQGGDTEGRGGAQLRTGACVSSIHD